MSKDTDQPPIPSTVRRRTLRSAADLGTSGSGNQATNDYTVGYGKPPRHTQFRKGQTGNPRGRPRGTPNFGAVVQKLLMREVSVREGGNTKMKSVFETMFLSLCQRALAGDLRAQKYVLELAERHISAPLGDQPSGPNTAPDVRLSDADAQILERYRQKILKDREDTAGSGEES